MKDIIVYDKKLKRLWRRQHLTGSRRATLNMWERVGKLYPQLWENRVSLRYNLGQLTITVTDEQSL